jgi:hypothetical protein
MLVLATEVFGMQQSLPGTVNEVSMMPNDN